MAAGRPRRRGVERLRPARPGAAVPARRSAGGGPGGAAGGRQPAPGDTCTTAARGRSPRPGRALAGKFVELLKTGSCVKKKQASSRGAGSRGAGSRAAAAR